MALYFITGNAGKFTEMKGLLPEIEQLDVDLPEIQSLNLRTIVETKLQAAFEHKQAEFIVEDTGVELDCLNGLPGPFIKWFLKTIGAEGIAKIAQMHGNNSATAKIVIGYAKSKENLHFFEAEMKGTVVPPRGDRGFGWDFIFQPDGFEKTCAEMTLEEKNQMSMRAQAAEHLRTFLNSRKKI